MTKLARETISPNVRTIIPFNSFYYGSDVVVLNNRTKCNIHQNGVIEIDAALLCTGIELNGWFDAHEDAGVLYDVNVNGIPADADKLGVGSKRFCTWSSNLAESITKIINHFDLLQIQHWAPKKYLGSHESGSIHTMIDPVCSRYFRFMKYKNGGEHFPHYDSDFIYNHFVTPTTRVIHQATTHSVVVYLSDCETGELCFVRDDRENHQYTDWNRQATNDEIVLRIKPRRGKVVIFPHDMCHTVLPFKDTNRTRIIARGDILFQVATNV